ncbi:MAG: hypothetical protein NWF01_10020 [Candidatus Bathyarchaeota archaeon]|nr:hypothetical protein [Candidatus Bathyarchaeota archaeon]
MKKQKTQTIILTATLLIILSLTAANLASAAKPPVFTISQDSGCVGDIITVSGEKFAPNSNVKIELFMFETKTDEKGKFNDELTIPGEGLLCAGEYEVVAIDDKGNKDSTTFKIMPSIVLTPNCGAVDSKVKVHGDCFPDGKIKEISITFDDKLLLTIKEYPMGMFDAEITIPKASVGEHTIKATTYYGDTAQATFMVTPQIPLPEYPFGAIAAIAACIGAYAVIKKGKSRLNYNSLI